MSKLVFTCMWTSNMRRESCRAIEKGNFACQSLRSWTGKRAQCLLRSSTAKLDLSAYSSSLYYKWGPTFMVAWSSKIYICYFVWVKEIIIIFMMSFCTIPSYLAKFLCSFCVAFIIEFWIVIAFCFCNKKRIHALPIATDLFFWLLDPGVATKESHFNKKTYFNQF